MKQGVLYAIGAYFMWGMLPLYWKVFEKMGAWEILAHRIIWSAVFVVALLFVTKKLRYLKSSVTEAKTWIALVLSSLIISGNWLIYIWAVNIGHVMETSLGYYINPLLSVLFGVLFLKERMRLGQWIAIVLAAIGVSVMTFHYGKVPWVAILLALTFALYGLAKKTVKLEPMMSLAWETLFVAPIALAYVLALQVNGQETALSLEAWQIVLLTLAGVATALPLYWFAQAAKRLPLSMVGFVQYLSPTITLLMAIFLFHEPFTQTHLISFGFIWSALVVFTISSLRSKGTSTAPAPNANLAFKKKA
ncbi:MULTISPECIES: EamA family transporter RarD [Brevibacillus]|jgi:chloramphenicol-sensitive protein RarD|uniref:EamA family transporter RarD n=1 Tax=Brevibacillus TaxID=55080 RepID=UPI0004F2B518|nr:EamA family transporter RarD [Brevibacillus borstelensis]KKX54324.1 transporter [Brevibacillus borstelensis cifa_chp40]MBE5395065.1 EamA family transporter RarD [Brevibacillus borstelensis]MED1743464.1 EamA family transporter RarD [Brevibacillus borstelensis]MED1850195.1 EamA family transporter RarD [Brevibacillus borstelensis]MED1873236.1 EamA family transporter RarD [Brevibacillus borstelensis]